MAQKENVSFVVNKERFNYLLDLYNITKEEIISRIHKNRVRPILDIETLNNIISGKEKIQLNVLKKIDSIFNQGISWYISKRPLPNKKESSILFRKKAFNIELNLESRKKINKYEKLKFTIQNLCNSINYNNKITIQKYSVNDNPEVIANEMIVQFEEKRKFLLENKLIKKDIYGESRLYLKNLIRIIEEMNIFVFELLETHNKNERVNFDGFFIIPNIIVIKRQKYYKREIFTLMHEFAHCLLNIEEVDEISEQEIPMNTNKIEKWCNDFAFYFLLNGHKERFNKLNYATKKNNFHNSEIEYIYKNSFISATALYTRLRIEKKISQTDYQNKIEEINNNIRRRQEREKNLFQEKKQMALEAGKKPPGGPPRAIESNLFKDIVKINYFQGNISESEARKHLKISGKKNIEEVGF